MSAEGVAFVFPGQGSQFPGMGRELAETSAPARETFAEIDAALGFSLSGLCFEGTAEDLALTENTQPAVLSHSVAAWRCLEERGVVPDFVAGHSLGEYSALVAAGVLGAADAVRTVRARGRYMQEAVPVGEGAMAAVLGLSADDVQELCEGARQADEVLSPANYNSPGQVVIAGHRRAVERAMKLATERGARRSILLPVSAPFHCALMQPAANRLASDLAALELGSFRMPLVANVTAREVEDETHVCSLLEQQVTAPVLWEGCVRRLVELGATTFVEVGPGQVLAGLIRRVSREVRSLPAGTPEQLEAVAEALA